jgi:anti-sigma regulatory factor (Ser/Thr protein kinase)
MNLLRLPFVGADESASMRSRTAQLLDGQPVEVVQDVLLVITELVDNVVQHTDGGGELLMGRDDGAVRVEVYDHSRAFPQLQRHDVRRAGGRGLLLVAAIAATWGSRPTPTGKVVWAHVTTPPIMRRDR